MRFKYSYGDGKIISQNERTGEKVTANIVKLRKEYEAKGQLPAEFSTRKACLLLGVDPPKGEGKE